jgi:hypothetical protein
VGLFAQHIVRRRCRTILISVSLASSADGRRQPDPLCYGVATHKVSQSGPADWCGTPILHLNGYKISNPTDPRLRIEHEELEHCCAATDGRPTSSRDTSPS